ncbi:TraR/DksA family transcriptional regulator [Corallococcus sp. H22C18031201]|uniref:TraR/DksA family transcriptional regulator n=1 Tax=Citreicoccus inhibens TaxID=2849499 RepID=UPI000E72297F|nr:TraR/DksA C4-type zinc finger protein [Citreicoccus inhibens]MBU8900477.1 TraR/DksA C4-type zinc finger protein [Citreicoccus inhibens]RJS20720.1 TraR/DksA family transcriptional regulator [Corallococcus sp. H22C18031201]
MATSREKDLMRIRAILQRRRRELLSASDGAHRELSALKEQERDPEYEENAQSELADYTLSSLVESQRREVMLIDAALRRMDMGVFGTCVDCGADIPIERLEALPFAIRCEEDATRHELEMRGGHTTAAPTL